MLALRTGNDAAIVVEPIDLVVQRLEIREIGGEQPLDHGGRNRIDAAEDRPRGGERIVPSGTRDSEVGDVHLVIGAEEEIPGLQIAVDDAGGMRGVER